MDAISVSADSLDNEIVYDLLGAVHDRWFDLETVKVDEERKVTFRISSSKRSTPDRQLTFSEVARISVLDEAEIGNYYINEIEIDKDRNTIVITCGFLLTITLFLHAGWTLECRDI